MAEKNPEIEITWEMVQESTGSLAKMVQWRRQQLNRRREGYRANFQRYAKWAFLSQAIIIVLGFVASMAAVFSKGPIWSVLDNKDLVILERHGAATNFGG